MLTDVVLPTRDSLQTGEKPWVCLVTGANRGLGLEFVKQCVKAAQTQGTAAHLLCCCRSPFTAQELLDLQRETASALLKFTLLQLDVTNSTNREGVILYCQETFPEGINMVLNNAGIMPHYCSEKLETVEMSELHRTYNNNFIGPTLLLQGLINLLKISGARCPAKTKIVSMSSKSGSVGHERFMIGGAYDYRASKVAINRTARNLAAEFGKCGVLSVAVCPGWAATDMGNRGHLTAEVPVAESIEGVRAVLKNVTQDTNGLFVDHLGVYPPW